VRPAPAAALLFGLAAARSPDLDTLRRFAELLQATAVTEMDLHRSYAAELGITPAELAEEEMAAVTRGSSPRGRLRGTLKLSSTCG